jgi:hypothetical protein
MLSLSLHGDKAVGSKWRQPDSSTWLPYNKFEIMKQTFSNIEKTRLGGSANARICAPNARMGQIPQTRMLAPVRKFIGVLGTGLTSGLFF